MCNVYQDFLGPFAVTATTGVAANILSMPTFRLEMRLWAAKKNILCSASIFCLKSSLARKMRGFVESGFLSRAKNVVWARDKKPDSTNPSIFLAKQDLRQKMWAWHEMFWAGSNILIERKKVGMERFSRFESQNHEPFLRHLKTDSQTWKALFGSFCKGVQYNDA